jgi:integrase
MLEQYISYRRSLGYCDTNLRTWLRRFDRFVYDKNATIDDLDPELFLEFRQTLQHKPAIFNALLPIVRGFCDFLVRRRIMDENPVTHIQSYPKGAFIPFIFSAVQTDGLIDAAEHLIRKNPTSFLTDLSAYTAILLMARCGLRIGEPLRLLLDHYDPKYGTLYIEKTKFSKDRLIPVSKSAMDELNNFLSVRKTFNESNLFFLPGKQGRPLSDKAVYKTFDKAVKEIGIDCPKRIIADTTFGRPTPHSLRHSFAVNTLKKIRQRGQSAQHALPVLSAYLGHRKYRYTAVYLKVLDAEHRQALVDFSIHRQEEI